MVAANVVLARIVDHISRCVPLDLASPAKLTPRPRGNSSLMAAAAALRLVDSAVHELVGCLHAPIACQLR